jgi:hypothetical protein
MDMKTYLAGPMRGIKEFNYPAFHAAAAKLRAWGHDVFNPAEMDTVIHGRDVSAGNETGSLEQAAQEHDFDLRTALLIDTAWICEYAECIAMLPGWERSKGAAAEHALAVALELKIIYLREGEF